MNRWLLIGLFGVLGLLAGRVPAVEAAGEGCVPNCSTYDPGTQPTCTNPTITWSDGCGGTCKRTFSKGGCVVSKAPACDQSVSGHYLNCPTISCTKSGPACDPNDKPDDPYGAYGYAVPGDSLYGFNSVPAFKAAFPTPEAADMLGLSAKGNIIVGDYTSASFQQYIAPKLNPSAPGSIVQPYVPDPTDASLGYNNASPAACKGISPCFNGNYTAYDGGYKGANPSDKRRFYESSLTNAQFKSYINADDPLLKGSKDARIDAVLYTNHAVAGYVPPKSTKKVRLTGTIISRDDALVVDSDFVLNHDMRLNMDQDFSLPVALARPTLAAVQECHGTECAE